MRAVFSPSLGRSGAGATRFATNGPRANTVASRVYRAATRGAALLGLVLAPAGALEAQGLTGYNVFTFHDFLMQNTEVNGTLAVGGNATLSSFAVAPNVGGPRPEGVLVVGGTATLSNGQVNHGHSYFAQAPTGGATVLGPQTVGALPVDFASEYARLSALSAQYSALDTNATAKVSGNGVWFGGTNLQANVFTVDASDLIGKGHYNFYAPDDTSSIIINVKGFAGKTLFQWAGFNLCTVKTNDTQFSGCSQATTDNPGGLASRVLWNFDGVTGDAVSIFGSMTGAALAPNVDFTLRWGQHNGDFVAANIDSQTEFYRNAFQGFVPENPQPGIVTPEPASVALVGFGALALGLVHRRRRNRATA